MADGRWQIAPDKSAICHLPSAIRPGPSPRGRGAYRNRPALTLLEVIISVAIFLFALVAIGRLVTLGTDNAAEAQQLSLATMLCQSKLAEVMAGAEALTSSGSYSSFQDNPDWQWRLECSESAVTGLWKVQVWVQRQRSDGVTIEVTLGQFVLPPAQRGSSLDTNATTTTSTGGSP